MSGVLDWLADATKEQKQTLLAASLGWMLDSMDVMLYALVLGQVQKELHLTPAISGLMMSATLISAAFGGIGFGWFADRSGRARALTGSVLVYSLSTCLCGFAQTGWQLLIFRILLGFGMGGEWASGAALVAETWPDHHRGKALALMQSCWAIGYALGALVVALVMPHFGWRAVFFVGVAPALITLWLRRRLKEPEIWKREHQARQSFSSLFRGKLGRSMVCLLYTSDAADE